jgi:hypothetical protein
MYLLVGDGGTMDGMSNTMIDQDPQPYCQDPSSYTTPWYQPTTSGEPLLTFQDGEFCPEVQPGYSAYRDPSYGYGEQVYHDAPEFMAGREICRSHRDRLLACNVTACSFGTYLNSHAHSGAALLWLFMAAVNCLSSCMSTAVCPAPAGMLALHNITHAEWSWYRNQDEEGVPADSITIVKNPDCTLVRDLR